MSHGHRDINKISECIFDGVSKNDWLCNWGKINKQHTKYIHDHFKIE